MSLSEEERKQFEKELKEAEAIGNESISGKFSEMIKQMEAVVGRALTDDDGTPLVADQDPKFIAERAQQFRLQSVIGNLRSEDKSRRSIRFTRPSGPKSKPPWTSATAASTA